MNTTSSTTVPKSQQSKTWLQDLHVYSGYRDQISLWRHILQPFRMLGSLSVLWGAIIFTSAMSWLVVLSVVLSQIFSAPPYFFSVGAVGTTNVAAFIGSILGTLISGPLIDRLARYLSKKNRGIFGESCRHFDLIYSRSMDSSTDRAVLLTERLQSPSFVSRCVLDT